MSPRAKRPREKRPELVIDVVRTGLTTWVSCSEATPSINQITSMVPIQRAREAKRWVTAIAAASKASGVRYTPPVRITAFYYWPTRRRRDLWNYPPKWAVDGLVAGGLIPDDNSDDVAECTVCFRQADPGYRWRMVLEISPVGAAS